MVIHESSFDTHFTMTIFLVYDLSPILKVYRYIPDDTCSPSSFLPFHTTL